MFPFGTTYHLEYMFCCVLICEYCWLAPIYSTDICSFFSTYCISWKEKNYDNYWTIINIYVTNITLLSTFDSFDIFGCQRNDND